MVNKIEVYFTKKTYYSFDFIHISELLQIQIVNYLIDVMNKEYYDFWKIKGAKAMATWDIEKNKINISKYNFPKK